MWIESARWESNPRPASYKDAALTTELRARSSSRAGGNRTHTWRIKSPLCCQLHHNPIDRSGVCVSIDACATSFGSSYFAVVSGSPESRTQRDLVISQVWTTGPRLPSLFKSGRWDSNPRHRASKARRLAAALHPVSQSERPDLNRRRRRKALVAPGRETRRDTRLRYVLIVSSPCGSRTQVSSA